MPIYKADGKKDGKQKYRVIVNFTDSAGAYKTIERISYGLNDAKLLETQLLKGVKEKPSTNRMTLRELFEEYTAMKKYEVRESTLDKSIRTLEYHVMPELENKRIDKLTLSVLNNWKMGMEEKNISLGTKKNVFGDFRALLNYGVKMEYIIKNPLVKLGNFKSTVESKKKMTIYTADEFNKFISTARKCAQQVEESGNTHEWCYYVFFAIAFYTGLRKGEIHALRWSDIAGGYMSVNRSISQKLKGIDRETAPKNYSSIRTVQMPIPLIEILDAHKVRCANLKGYDETYLVCGGLKPLRDTTIQNRNQKYAELAGVKVIRIHDFRHSHVSLLANEGINIQEVARRLGHSKIEMTWNTYSHLYPREEERAVEILNKIHG